MTRSNFRDAKVKFRQPEKGCRYGWTDRSASAKVIFVNEVLLHRMEMIDQADKLHEYQYIEFVVAVAIIHECAHLALGWKNILDSPFTYNFEVGTVMEMKMFGGIYRVEIQQSTWATSNKMEEGWTR